MDEWFSEWMNRPRHNGMHACIDAKLGYFTCERQD